MLKTCTRCGELKSLDQFHKKKRIKGDGLRSTCKSCRKIESRNYNEQNREKRTSYMREYYRDNRQAIIDRVIQWQRDNPDKVYERKLRRQIRKRGNLSEQDLQISMGRREAIANDPCFYCGTTEGLFQVDHFYPLAKGGDDRWSNLVHSCKPCNLSKSARCGTVFMMRRMNNG